MVFINKTDEPIDMSYLNILFHQEVQYVTSAATGSPRAEFLEGSRWKGHGSIADDSILLMQHNTIQTKGRMGQRGHILERLNNIKVQL